MKCINNYI